LIGNLLILNKLGKNFPECSKIEHASIAS